MANAAMTSMAGCLHGSSSKVVLDGLNWNTRVSSLNSNNKSGGFIVRAQATTETETSRRAVLGLVAAGLASGSFVQAVLADAKPIKLGGPPPPSGGLRKLFNYFLNKIS